VRALVLGGGRIGSAMARDLAADRGAEVVVVDADPAALARLRAVPGVTTERADGSDPATVRRLAAKADVVLGALPSAMGLRALEAVIDAGRPCVDVSFMPEDPLALSPRAEARGVVALVDFGVAPGTSHLLAGHAARRLAPCTRIEILVGGVPAERRPPWEYAAAFAPSDVIEEYVRPARVVVDGRVVEKEALSEVEAVDLPGVGRLEAFLTDGLRSLLRTLRVPSMVEKTMRWPGHAARMRALRDAGCFDDRPVEVPSDAGTVRVRPVDVTSALLFPQWRYAEGEDDLTVMRVVAEGSERGRPVRLTWDLLDRTDRATGTRSMARTTAYPATVAARLLAAGRFPRPGVHPPETLGAEPDLFRDVLAGLAERGVRFVAREETLGAG
jgi:saccharopine dehydrogenase-like NADP-dependent oxidoreductase